ncbi:hypothetical protein AB0D67_19965 [Streptosporangium sp. NPDC048047]|uniref:hypothetical protein n=1 Tax=Streptosporangium sp. NPDC048047 TaxID=3155748 RepID=UPI003426419C
MNWIFAGTGLALAGLALLAVLGLRVLVAARELGREVDRARRRIEPARALLAERTAEARLSVAGRTPPKG